MQDRPNVWLLQDGEPLPIDESPRLMRTGHHARRLVERGYAVTWWTSRFSHNLKAYRGHEGLWSEQGPGYTIALLDGPGYQRNMSWQRMLHYRTLAAHFHRVADTLPRPDLLVCSYPSPEMADAGGRFARRHDVPFVVDIRDPWPDIFSEYLPKGLRWSLAPVLWYYRRKLRRIARDARGIVAVSKAMLDWGLAYAGRGVADHDRVFHIGFPRHSPDRAIDVPPSFTPERPLVCLFATTCGRSYHGEMLVDAARLLEGSGERRIRFIASGDGDMRASWMARARGLQSIEFTGWISNEQLQAHFRAAHVGLVLMKGGIPRFWLGNKIFEYLSAYLGLVSDISGEASDLVDRRRLGVTVARGAPEALAAALSALVADAPRVRAYMQNAKLTFLEEFDREAIDRRYIDYLGTLLNGRDTSKGTA